jgi:hypothetical protein
VSVVVQKRATCVLKTQSRGLGHVIYEESVNGFRKEQSLVKLWVVSGDAVRGAVDCQDQDKVDDQGAKREQRANKD